MALVYLRGVVSASMNSAYGSSSDWCRL